MRQGVLGLIFHPNAVLVFSFVKNAGKRVEGQAEPQLTQRVTLEDFSISIIIIIHFN